MAKKKVKFSPARLTSRGLLYFYQVARKRSVRASVSDFLYRMACAVEEMDTFDSLPESLHRNAEWIANYIGQQVPDVKQLAIAVDAAPGVGKTTLTRLLAQIMDLKPVSLDDYTTTRQRLCGYSAPDYRPVQPTRGTIMEHNRLLMNYSPDEFDVIIHFTEDPRIIKEQLLTRKKSALMIDVMDYDLWQSVGYQAFNLTMNAAVTIPESHIFMKIKPECGFRSDEILDLALKRVRGFSPDGLTRQQKLISLVSGVKNQASGWRPFVKPQIIEELFKMPFELFLSSLKGK